MRRLLTLIVVLMAFFVALKLVSAHGVATLIYGSAGIGTLSEAARATLFVFNSGDKKRTINPIKILAVPQS